MNPCTSEPFAFSITAGDSGRILAVKPSCSMMELSRSFRMTTASIHRCNTSPMGASGALSSGVGTAEGITSFEPSHTAMSTSVEQYTSEFRKILRTLTDGGRLRMWEVFQDFSELSFCAIAKETYCAAATRGAIEARYMKVAGRYDGEQLKGFCRMLGITSLVISQRPEDFLGGIYEEEGFCEKEFGAQFFTPQHLARVKASLTLGNISHEIPVVTLSEPACGSGRLVLACAAEMRDQGFDVQKRLWVDAVDLDFVCQQITYLQLAFAQIPGRVSHGNSLSRQIFDSAITPAGIFLLNESEYLRSWLRGESLSQPSSPVVVSPDTTSPADIPDTPNLPAAPEPSVQPEQGTLF